MYNAVLIMDIIKSKRYSIESRQLLQELIATSIEYLNTLFTDTIVKKVGFSAGDEIQGMFESCQDAFLYFRHLSLIVGKDTFRGGIGEGSWDIKMDDASSSSQDGEAYHLAREAIAESHKKREYALTVKSRNGHSQLLTVAADHSLGILKMRTDSQNDLALRQELISPLVVRDDDDCIYCRNLIREILEIRFAFLIREDEGKKSRNALAHRSRYEFDVPIRRPLPLRYIEREGMGDFLELPETANEYSRELAYALGKSRQSIEAQLSKARVLQERNAAALFWWMCSNQRVNRI